MGCAYEARCADCGKEFEVNSGGGFIFHLLRCDICGKNKTILFDKIQDLHNRCFPPASANDDDWVQEISYEEYNKGVEDFAGNCRCGGKFRFDAPPRCPKCHSTNVEFDEDGPTVCYD